MCRPLALLMACFLTVPWSAAVATGDEGVRLFAGGDLSGWVEEQHDFFQRKNPNVSTWSVKDGVVVCDGSHGNCGFLRYDRKLSDFMLRLEYRMSKDCNSGVCIRVPRPYNGKPNETLPSHTGYEVQILDDAGMPASKTSSGSLYNLLAPKVSAARPAGEWNTMEIVCRGPRIKVTLNGQVVQDVDQDKVEAIKDRPRSGYLLLQNHGHRTEFRNVRLKEEPADVPPQTVTHAFLATGAKTYIRSGDGKITWTFPHASRDGWVLPNGNVLLALAKSKQYPGGAAVEVTRDGKVVFEFKGTQSEVNTVQPLPDDRILLTEAGNKPRLLEVGRDGKVLVEVPLQAQTRDHHLQTRMARKLATGTYLVPQLLDKVVREYDRDGKVIWEVKTPDMPFTAIRLPDGHTLIGCTLGNLVIEVTPDQREVWRLSNNDLPDKPINDACGVQRLPNGNTVVTSHHAKGDEVRLTEVTPQKKVVWTFRDASLPGIHHFQILDTNGKPVEGSPLR